MYGSSCSLVFSGKKNVFNDNELNIISFEGEEAVSQLYRFELTVAVKTDGSKNQWDDMVEMLNEPATLVLNKGESKDKISWHGIITRLVQDGADKEYCYYKLLLEPEVVKLRWLFCSDVYLDKQLDEIITSVMEQADFKKTAKMHKDKLTPSDNYDYIISTSKEGQFSDLLKNSHQNFTCQFEESYLDFIQRRSEFYGVHYLFAQLEKNACMVFSYDLKVPQKDSPDLLQAEYTPVYSSDTASDTIVITHLSKECQMSVSEVYLQRSSTFLHASEEKLLSAKQQLSDHQSEMAFYSTKDRFELLEDDKDNDKRFVQNRHISGQYLANIRAKAREAEQAQVTGVAVTPGIVAGRFVHISEQVTDNQRKDDYFVLSVKHRWGSENKAKWKHDKATVQNYQADFILHPCFKDESQQVPFYPKQRTDIPRIESLVSGFIDGQPYKTRDNPNAPDTIDTTYPALDELGRYRVRFAFAKQLKPSYTNNSAWLRLATPYAGGSVNREFDQHGTVKNRENSYGYGGGMHFPLRAGTEVLIAFINGDPDYPVIVSALANVAAPSPVTGTIKDSKGKVIKNDNGNQFVLQTPVGNRMAITDYAKKNKDGKYKHNPYSSWSFYSPAMDTQFNLGGYCYRANDKNIYTTSGFKLATKGMGLIQSDEVLHLMSKTGVKITSGDKSPDKQFSSFIKKVSERSLDSSPAVEAGFGGEKGGWLEAADLSAMGSSVSGKATGGSISGKATGGSVSGDATGGSVSGKATGGSISGKATGVAVTGGVTGVAAGVSATGLAMDAKLKGIDINAAAKAIDIKLFAGIAQASASLAGIVAKVDVAGEKVDITAAVYQKLVLAAALEIFLGAKASITAGAVTSVSASKTKSNLNDNAVATNSNELVVAKTTTTTTTNHLAAANYTIACGVGGSSLIFTPASIALTSPAITTTSALVLLG